MPTPPSWLVAVLATIVFFIVFVVAYYFIRGYLPASRVVVQAPIESVGEGTATFTMYYTNWCKYSQEALPIWQQLDTLMQTGYTYGGYSITVNSVDCEANKNTCAAAGVDGYPTYKLTTSANTFTYQGPPNVQTYQQFLKDTLGTEVAPS